MGVCRYWMANDIWSKILILITCVNVILFLWSTSLPIATWRSPFSQYGEINQNSLNEENFIWLQFKQYFYYFLLHIYRSEQHSENNCKNYKTKRIWKQSLYTLYHTWDILLTTISAHPVQRTTTPELRQTLLTNMEFNIYIVIPITFLVVYYKDTT